MAITIVMARDHFRTRRSRSPSFPCRPVELVPTARFCGLIIFPNTPPEELAPTARTGLTPICWAVTFCRLAKRAFAEVSEPVSATPSHPINEERDDARDKDKGTGRREPVGLVQGRVGPCLGHRRGLAGDLLVQPRPRHSYRALLVRCGVGEVYRLLGSLYAGVDGSYLREQEHHDYDDKR